MQQKYYVLKISSTNNRILILYKKFLIKSLNKMQMRFSIAFLPKVKKSFSLLKSPHVYKKAIENFEFFKYKIVFILKKRINKHYFKLLLLNKPKMLKICFSLKSKGISSADLFI